MIDTTNIGSEVDRVAAIRSRLLELGLDGNDPRWSSDVLDRLLVAVVQGPGGFVNDLFAALLGVLGDYGTELSPPVAAFIKDMVVCCFHRYRSSYDCIDWEQFIHNLRSNPTKAQLYLALLAVPPKYFSAQLADAITDGLKGTPFREEAASLLSA